MRKFIKIDTATRIDLLKEFAVSEKTLYNALNFLTSGYTADSIRCRAKELGGVLFRAVETTEAMGIQHCLHPLDYAHVGRTRKSAADRSRRSATE